MKKLFLVVALALVAAGCNNQNNQTLNPQSPPAQQTPQTSTYKNATYGFEFQYPADVGFVTPTYALLQDKIVQLNIAGTEYPKTNFVDAGFAVSAQYAKSLADCLALNAPENGDGFKTTTVINGVTFYSTKGSGAGAGNRYDSVIYRALRSNQTCAEINETIHTGNIGNYPAGTVTEVDANKVQARLDSILNTFKFN